MENIRKNIRRVVIAGGIVAALGLTSFGLSNYLKSKEHARPYSDDIFRVSISDGLHGESDGLVDRIYITNLETDIILNREKHYDKFKAEFNGADKLLKEAKKRFEEFF